MESSKKSPKDVVATWNLPLNDGVHRIELEHGTTTGKRIIRVDGQEVLRKDWLFKLVGREDFFVKKFRCTAVIEASSVFSYQYSLIVDGKPFQAFADSMMKTLKAWEANLDGSAHYICLEKDTLNVLVNGEEVDSKGDFLECGMAITFELKEHTCCIKASKAAKKSGITYRLYIDGKEITEKTDW
ncbi:Fas apoptotic inhibitory molecule [Trichuris suis]|nr:Fas apoptotic inhibitory molecule [Trichuris suis]